MNWKVMKSHQPSESRRFVASSQGECFVDCLRTLCKACFNSPPSFTRTGAPTAQSFHLHSPLMPPGKPSKDSALQGTHICDHRPNSLPWHLGSVIMALAVSCWPSNDLSTPPFQPFPLLHTRHEGWKQLLEGIRQEQGAVASSSAMGP